MRPAVARGWGWVALAVWLVAGCDGDGGVPETGVAVLDPDAGAEVAAEAGAGDAPAGDLPAGDPVIGLWRGIFVTSQGEQRWGYDLRDVPFSAFAETSEGGFTEHAGGGDMEGGFVVNGVPPRPYWLHFHDLFLEGAPGQPPFDILQPTMGRVTSMAAPPRTMLELALDGLAPIQATDELYLYAPDPGTRLSGLLFAGAALPPEGHSRFDISFDVGEYLGAHLIEGTVSGDVTHLVQMVAPRVHAWPRMRMARRALRTSDLQLTAGGTARLAGTLTEIATVESATITWRHRALAELAREQPGSEVFRQEILLQTLPGANRHGSYGGGGTLFSAWTANPGDLPAETAATIEWGNPFPDHWGRVLEHVTSFASVLPAGTEHRWFVDGSIGGVQLLEPEQTVTVEPGVGPPRDIRIGGRDPAADLIGVGLHPVISWMPPAFGSANGYSVEIHVRRTPDGARPHAEYAGTLVVSGTSVRVPPGLLQPDVWAVAVVRAVANEHYGPRSPHRSAPQMAWADAISPAFRP